MIVEPDGSRVCAHVGFDLVEQNGDHFSCIVRGAQGKRDTADHFEFVESLQGLGVEACIFERIGRLMGKGLGDEGIVFGKRVWNDTINGDVACYLSARDHGNAHPSADFLGIAPAFEARVFVAVVNN